MKILNYIIQPVLHTLAVAVGVIGMFIVCGGLAVIGYAYFGAFGGWVGAVITVIIWGNMIGEKK